MSPVQQAIYDRNKKIVIGTGIVAAGLWIMLVLYVVAESKKDYSVIQPGIVEVHAPSPTGGGVPTATYMPKHASPSLSIQNETSAPQWSYLKNVPMTSVTPMQIHKTSNATVHSVGGGGGAPVGGGGGSNTTGASAARGIHTSLSPAMAYTGMIYIPTPHDAVTEVGATAAAGSIGNERRGVAPRRIDINEDPDEPFPDPIGDVAWGLMALLAMLYTAFVYCKKRDWSADANTDR